LSTVRTYRHGLCRLLVDNIFTLDLVLILHTYVHND
jgi:hypothetical protein